MLPIMHGITSRNLEHICVFFFLFEECEFGKHFFVAEFKKYLCLLWWSICASDIFKVHTS
jgi:hypothetical protein